MIDVVMPQLGESVAEGTVTKWLVRVGDIVKREQPLVEVATDKADTEVVSPADGRVAELRAKEGEVVPKHALIARIDETPGGAATAPPLVVPAARGSAPGAASEGSAAKPLSTPSTRKLALEAGVDLTVVQATGERGRVTRDDVIRASVPAPAVAAPQIIRPTPEAPAAPPAAAVAALPQELSQLLASTGGYVPPIPGVGYGSYKVPGYVARPGDEVVPFNRRRRITADHMTYSKHTSPHVLTVAEIDLHATSKLRELHKAQLKKEGVPLTFLVFICAAAVKALRKFPQVNSRVLDGSFVLLRDINLGVAVDTPGGLIVPSIKHADQLSLRGLAKSLDEMATRARAGKITADDLSGTTFSISNPGLRGNLFGAAIVSQPNVGILRMGEIKKRVVVVTSKDGEDSIAIHPMMYLAFSYDHRVIDGVLANDFLWMIADLLGRGEFEI